MSARCSSANSTCQTERGAGQAGVPAAAAAATRRLPSLRNRSLMPNSSSASTASLLGKCRYRRRATDTAGRSEVTDRDAVIAALGEERAAVAAIWVAARAGSTRAQPRPGRVNDR